MKTERESIEFDVFEAVCGVRGEIPDDFEICDSEAPFAAVAVGVVVDHRSPLPCTRLAHHAGDHVAAHTDGHVLARWRDSSVGL